MDVDKINSLVQEWINLDINPQTKEEIRQLHKNGDYETLNSKLSKRIAFGTAGLRSSMQSGFAHMNDVTILQAAQGLIAYLDKGTNKSLVIGYDHRFNSQRFAEITASVAIVKKFKVYYLGSIQNISNETLDLCPGEWSNVTSDRLYVHTPMVPFGIDHYLAGAGVMVTASHNPANDNGYKVYYGNGCQIIPPIDHDIATAIDENLHPWSNEVWDVIGNFKHGIETGLLVACKPEVTDAYISALSSKLLKSPDLNFEFVYTPVHGVGLEIFEKALAKFTNVQMKVVKKQQSPDPNFSTVSFPNPEEKGALDLAIKLAEESGVSLVVANDPDADRFSIAIKANGKWQQLTGNEIGFLFAQYIIEQTPKDELKNTWLVNSTVSSQILESMAKIDKFNFQDTLTGFKWIGNKAIDLKNEGYRVPFGYEEAIGFMFDLVNDKDGISAAVIWLQLYQKWFSDGLLTPLDKLQQGYKKYGYFKECNGYYKLDDLAKTPQIFTEIRNSFSGHYPDTIGDFKVVYWRDLTLGYESTTKDFKSILPADPSSQMITAILESNQQHVRFTCRGSGTEPKLKIYIEGRGNSENEAVGIAKECWQILKTHWFKPELYHIKEVLNG